MRKCKSAPCTSCRALQKPGRLRCKLPLDLGQALARKHRCCMPLCALTGCNRRGGSLVCHLGLWVLGFTTKRGGCSLNC